MNIDTTGIGHLHLQRKSSVARLSMKLVPQGRSIQYIDSVQRSEMMMDLKGLRSFMVVAETCHFGRAAQRLNIVQPALSAQIKALEQDVGAALFVRTSRRVELTAVGRLLQVEARRLLDQAARTTAAVAAAAQGLSGTVRVGFAGNAAFSGLMASDLAAFHAERPEIIIDVRELNGRQQVEALQRGSIDVGYCPDLESFPADLEARTLGEWKWIVALSRRSSLMPLPTLRLADVRDQPWIVYAQDKDDDGQLSLLRSILNQEPRRRHTVANTLTVLAMSAAGLGLALIPSSLCSVNVPDLAFKEIDLRDRRAKLMLLTRRNEASPAVAAYRDLERCSSFNSGNCSGEPA